MGHNKHPVAARSCQPPDRSAALEQTFCRGEFVKTPAGSGYITILLQESFPTPDGEQWTTRRQHDGYGFNFPQFFENFQLKCE